MIKPRLHLLGVQKAHIDNIIFFNVFMLNELM